MGRRNEYQRKHSGTPRDAQAVQICVWLRDMETEISAALWALWLWKDFVNVTQHVQVTNTNLVQSHSLVALV